MDQQTAPPSPESSSIRAQWTPARQRIFLTALLDTGSIARAASAAGMSRSSAHRLRVRLAGTAFDRLWDQAIAHHTRRLVDPFARDDQLVALAAHAPRAPTASQARR
jgi:AraC-like DNA-binding protein